VILVPPRESYQRVIVARRDQARPAVEIGQPRLGNLINARRDDKIARL
jgi:hypothetical protein